MSNITDWIKYDLYPTLFESIDIALPEHSFKRYSGNWRSKTYLDGSPHKDRVDKTVVSRKAPGWILEQGGATLSLVDYVMRRDRVEFIQAVKTLADVVGLQLPKDENFNQESYQRYKDQATLLEDCNSYFIYCLENSTGADEVREYLTSRGYSDEDIKAMELGYIPDQEKLINYLLNKGYSQSLIDEVVKLNKGIGSTHRLTIPYRSGGSVKGFKFRTTVDATPKYLNSTGLDRLGGFFNLSGVKGDKDVVIVEGELDSLHATAKGVENIVATGGSSISSDQVRDAIRRGAKSFTLCLDTEPGKEEETAKRINSAIEVILGEEVNRVYIVTLPDLDDYSSTEFFTEEQQIDRKKGRDLADKIRRLKVKETGELEPMYKPGEPIPQKTDPDRLIKDCGVERFKTVIAHALPYYEWRLELIKNKYNKVIDETRGLTNKQILSLEDEIVELGSSIVEPMERDRFKATAIDFLGGWGITEETLSITVDRLTSTRDKEAQAKEFKKLLSQATQLQDKGDTDKAMDLLEGKLKEVRIIVGKELLPPPLSFTTLLDEIATIPPAYKTGYSSLDKFVGFTPGAISLIAGRPSHGKTTLLFNLLLQMSNLYKDESFYFFTYEEPVKNISIKLLNRLTATDLSGHIREVTDLPKPTNYEYLKAYIRARRTDIKEIEEGKRKLQDLIDSQRIRVIGENYSVEQLSSLIAYVNKKDKIGGVFIDYIQRMRTERRTQDKRTEIAHISDQVLQIAKDSGLPIILGAQLNRATVSSGNKKPSLENLKEAGNLEEDANTVLSVYNDSREKEDNAEGDSYKGAKEVELEIKALKNREGEVNQTATLIFDKWTGVIKDQQDSKANYFK